MARRSPSESHSFWGSFSIPEALPNSSGSVRQSLNLEAGDTAFSESDGALYVCLDATRGSAVWSAVGSGVVVAGSEINLSLDGLANPGAPELIGGVYVPTTRLLSMNSRALLGISGNGGTYRVDLRLNTVNVPAPAGTVATFTVTNPNGFYDAKLEAPALVPAGWYDIELDAVSQGVVAFARGLYLTV